MKNYGGIILVCLTVLGSVILLGRSYANRHRGNDLIHVTGLGIKDLKSDLVIWSGSFNKKGPGLEETSKLLEKDRDIVRQYLLKKGVPAEQIVFSALNISHEYRSTYCENGSVKERIFDGFLLSQTVKIESGEVDMVEDVSRSITELTNRGIGFYSHAPNYYYTKLSQLKIEMVAATTEDARIRAEQIAENANSEIEDLRYAKMGVFQIITQNSTSKMKTATITMKLQFEL